MDQLAAELADDNVVFLEHDVDQAPSSRQSRWWAGYGAGGSVYLPLVMVDSGHQVSNGSEDFSAVYRGMVESSMARPAKARLAVSRERVGDALRFEIELINLSGVTLSSDNSATIHVLVYEDSTKGLTGREVIASIWEPITSLADGATASYALLVPVSTTSWDQVRSVVLADYVPDGSGGAYDMLQAARGE